MELKTRIANINNHLDTVSNSKVKLAFELLDTKRDTFWKDTKYKTWNRFCAEEVALAQSTVYVYLNAANLAEKNSFPKEVASLVVNTIGWERFRIGLTKIGDDEIITPAEFIKRYVKLNLNERVTYEEPDTDLVNFTFNIPDAAASILEGALLSRGMRVTNKSRTNVSSAMSKLIDDLIRE